MNEASDVRLTSTALDLARLQVRDAYECARRLIFDQHPDAVPSERDLTEPQRQALAWLKQAEAELVRLRQQNSERRGWPVD